MARVLFVIAVWLFLAGGTDALAQDTKVIDLGRKLYDTHGCAKCHQIEGKGTKMSVLDGVASKLTAAELRLWLTDPDAMMAKLPKRPIVKMKKVDLPDPDLDALVAYLQTLKKKS